MNKSKKLTLRTSTIRTLDLRRVTGGNIGNTGNTIGVPATHFCGGGGGGGQEGTKGVPCWDSFACYTVDC